MKTKELRFTLAGELPSKKNRWKVGRGGHVYIPKEITAQINAFLWQLKSIKCKMTDPLDGTLWINIEVFCSGRDKDLDNQITTLFDILQKGEIIKNDSQIVRIYAQKNRIEEGKDHVDIRIGCNE